MKRETYSISIIIIVIVLLFTYEYFFWKHNINCFCSDTNRYEMDIVIIKGKYHTLEYKSELCDAKCELNHNNKVTGMFCETDYITADAFVLGLVEKMCGY